MAAPNSGPNFQPPPPSESTIVNNGKGAGVNGSITPPVNHDDDIYITDEQPRKRVPMAAKAPQQANTNGIMVRCMLLGGD